MSRSTTKVLAAVLLLGSLLACGEEDPAAPEDDGAVLVFNGDVEQGTLGAPDGWIQSGAAARNHVLDWYLGNAAHGFRSLRIGSISSALAPNSALWYQPMPLDYQPNTDYVLSAMIKLDHVEGVGAAIALRGDEAALVNDFSEAFATTQSRLPLTGTTGWTRVGVRLTAVPANVDKLTVYLFLLSNSSGTVYFDDIHIARCGPTFGSGDCAANVP